MGKEEYIEVKLPSHSLAHFLWALHCSNLGYKGAFIVPEDNDGLIYRVSVDNVFRAMFDKDNDEKPMNHK